MNYNKVLLAGHLTRDPELRQTQSGSSVSGFGLAINRKYKKNNELVEDVCFIDITVWGKQAESCAQYLKKGSGAFIEGYLRLNSWETDSGEKKNKIEVIADTVQFLGAKENTMPKSDIQF